MRAFASSARLRPARKIRQPKNPKQLEVLVVTGHLDSLPGENVPSLTGFQKPLTETPRSASTVSDELMTRFNIRDIDGLIALVPGSFTQSFFGVAGTLDIRGTSGEVYFRGIRRLDNAGNYPTPIGASERVDVVRGPASPIHGPAKIGGYLNFNPKSARIEATGEFIDETKGAVALDLGSWGRTVGSVEVGGRGRIGGEGLRLLAVRRRRGFGQLLRIHGDRAVAAASLLRHGLARQLAVAVRRHAPRLRG